MSEKTPEYLEVEKRRLEKLRETCLQLFPEPTEIIFEIGCGHGDFLTAYAPLQQPAFCLGIDLVTKRIQSANKKVTKLGLPNAAFLKADLQELMAYLPDHVRFREVFMLFPDPWPKKRHFKKRMLQHALLKQLAARMGEGGMFALRTDHEGYFEWGLEHFRENPYWEIDPNTPWPFEKETYFQGFMESWQSLIARRNAAQVNVTKTSAQTERVE